MTPPEQSDPAPDAGSSEEAPAVSHLALSVLRKRADFLRTWEKLNNAFTKQEVLQVKYKDIVSGKDMSTNYQLQAGDTLVVP